jgi:hypothetical protein
MEERAMAERAEGDPKKPEKKRPATKVARESGETFRAREALGQSVDVDAERI